MHMHIMYANHCTQLHILDREHNISISNNYIVLHHNLEQYIVITVLFFVYFLNTFCDVGIAVTPEIFLCGILFSKLCHVTTTNFNVLFIYLCESPTQSSARLWNEKTIKQFSKMFTQNATCICDQPPELILCGTTICSCDILQNL